MALPRENRGDEQEERKGGDHSPHMDATLKILPKPPTPDILNLLSIRGISHLTGVKTLVNPRGRQSRTRSTANNSHHKLFLVPLKNRYYFQNQTSKTSNCCCLRNKLIFIAGSEVLSNNNGRNRFIDSKYLQFSTSLFNHLNIIDAFCKCSSLFRDGINIIEEHCHFSNSQHIVVRRIRPKSTKKNTFFRRFEQCRGLLPHAPCKVSFFVFFHIY